MKTELWRALPAPFNFYEVSDQGKVRNIITGQKLKITPVRGFNEVRLASQKGTVAFKVARLVARAYLKDWDPKKKVHREDGNTLNDNVNNIYLKY